MGCLTVKTLRCRSSYEKFTPPIERAREVMQCSELGGEALRLRLDATELRFS
jgi:hypothetical protein